MNRPVLFYRIGCLFLLLLACICQAQNRDSARSKATNQTGRATYVERFPNGYALIRYSGAYARELRNGRDADAVDVLFDKASRPVYCLAPEGDTIEFYKVVIKSNRELIYAIPSGPYETRVYEGPFRPEQGFPRRLTNVRDVPDIDKVYLNPSARQKVVWLEEMPMLGSLK